MPSRRHYETLQRSNDAIPIGPEDASKQSSLLREFRDRYRRAAFLLCVQLCIFPSSRSAAPSILRSLIARAFRRAFLARCRKQTRNAAAC